MKQKIWNSNESEPIIEILIVQPYPKLRTNMFIWIMDVIYFSVFPISVFHRSIFTPFLWHSRVNLFKTIFFLRKTIVTSFFGGANVKKLLSLVLQTSESSSRIMIKITIFLGKYIVQLTSLSLYRFHKVYFWINFFLVQNHILIESGWSPN